LDEAFALLTVKYYKNLPSFPKKHSKATATRTGTSLKHQNEKTVGEEALEGNCRLQWFWHIKLLQKNVHLVSIFLRTSINIAAR